jgi:hypothetical protein
VAGERVRTGRSEGKGIGNAKSMVQISGFMVRPFWTLEGEAQQMEMSHFMRNLTIAGG